MTVLFFKDQVSLDILNVIWEHLHVFHRPWREAVYLTYQCNVFWEHYLYFLDLGARPFSSFINGSVIWEHILVFLDLCMRPFSSFINVMPFWNMYAYILTLELFNLVNQCAAIWEHLHVCVYLKPCRDTSFFFRQCKVD